MNQKHKTTATFKEKILIKEIRSKRSRSIHVRKHFLRRAEKWYQITDISKPNLSVIITEISKTQQCGYDLDYYYDQGEYTPGIKELYEKFYKKYVFHSIEHDEYEHKYSIFEGRNKEPKSLYILDTNNIIIICEQLKKHPQSWVWRTAYRLTCNRKQERDLRRIHNDHVRSLRLFESLSYEPQWSE